MNVGDRMSRSVLAVEPATSLRDAARRMCDRRVGSVLVMEGERMLGIVTERDVLVAFADGRFEASVDEVMTRDPETAEPDESLDQARLVMLHGGFRHLPVVENRSVVGVLSIRDLLADEGEAVPRGV